MVRSNNCDLSKITWPRHADGSCDYEDGGKSAAESSVRKPAPATEHAEEAALPEAAESEPSNKEMESADAPSKESTDTDAKQNAALQVLPIAAGVAAFAVLLVVILLAGRKRKARKQEK